MDHYHRERNHQGIGNQAPFGPVRRDDHTRPREYQDDASTLHQGGEAGNTERHQEKPKRLPPVERAATPARVQKQCDPDDGRQPQRGEPQPRVRVEAALRRLSAAAVPPAHAAGFSLSKRGTVLLRCDAPRRERLSGRGLRTVFRRL